MAIITEVSKSIIKMIIRLRNNKTSRAELLIIIKIYLSSKDTIKSLQVLENKYIVRIQLNSLSIIHFNKVLWKELSLSIEAKSVFRIINLRLIHQQTCWWSLVFKRIFKAKTNHSLENSRHCIIVILIKKQGLLVKAMKIRMSLLVNHQSSLMLHFNTAMFLLTKEF